MTPGGRPEPAGTVIVRAGVVVYASEGAAALAGRGVGDIVGHQIGEFIAPEMRAMVVDRYERRLRGEPVAEGYEVALALPGGGRRLVEIHVERDGRDALVHLRDLAPREARRLRLDAVATLGAALQIELREEAIHARVRDGLWALGLASAVLRAEPDGVRVAWARVPPEVSERFPALAGVPLDGYLGRFTELSRRVLAEGAQFTEDWGVEASRLVPDAIADAVRTLVNGSGLSKAAAVRLGERGDADLYLVVAGDWLAREDVPAVRLFAAQLAAALAAARAVDDLSRRNADLAALNHVAKLAGEATELPAFLALASGVLAGAAGCAGTAVYVLDEGAGELVLAHVDGTPPEVAAAFARQPLDGFLGRALRERAPRVGAAGEPKLRGLAALGFQSVAAVPLLVRSRPVGALAAGFHAPAGFARGRIELLAGVGAHVAAAIESHRLLRDLRGRVEELSLLNEVGRALVETLDFERVLGAGVRNLARIVDAPDAYLALATPDGKTLEVRAAEGSHPEHVGMRLPAAPPAHNLPALVFHGREPLVVEDGASDPRINQSLRALTGGRGYLGLPLVVRERTIGSVLIVETRRPRLFTPAEVERAAGIANQLAVAAENARLYEDLRRSYAELERAQRRAIQGERLAALGEMSAAVAHEVRNPLGVIFNSLGSLRRLLRPSGDARLLLDIVGEEADRLNRIVGDLLDFARPTTPELRPEPLDRVLEEAIAAALAQAPRGVEISCELAPTLPPVPMDPRLVRQAALNLVANAAQAMPEGGRVSVRTRAEGDEAVIEVADAGPGIPEEVRARIFEPFFTTKASGTGLGLAVVRRIAEAHGGSISVRSRPGEGTCFALRLPLVRGAVEKRPAMG